MNPRQYVVYVGFLVLVVAFSITLRDAGFLTAANLITIVQQTAPITVMAVGMVLVLTAGQIDLSIGAIVALALSIQRPLLQLTDPDFYHLDAHMIAVRDVLWLIPSGASVSAGDYLAPQLSDRCDVVLRVDHEERFPPVARGDNVESLALQGERGHLAQRSVADAARGELLDQGIEQFPAPL